MLKMQCSLKLSHPRIRGVIIVVPGFEMQNHCTFLTSLLDGGTDSQDSAMVDHWQIVQWFITGRQCNGSSLADSAMVDHWQIVQWLIIGRQCNG